MAHKRCTNKRRVRAWLVPNPHRLRQLCQLSSLCQLRRVNLQGINLLRADSGGTGLSVSGVFVIPWFRFRDSCFGFRDSGFGFRVSGFGLRASGFGLRVSGLGFRVEGFRGRVWGLGLCCLGSGISGFGFRSYDFSGFGFYNFRVSGFGVSGLSCLGQRHQAVHPGANRHG